MKYKKYQWANSYCTEKHAFICKMSKFVLSFLGVRSHRSFTRKRIESISFQKDSFEYGPTNRSHGEGMKEFFFNAGEKVTTPEKTTTPSTTRKSQKALILCMPKFSPPAPGYHLKLFFSPEMPECYCPEETGFFPFHLRHQNCHMFCYCTNWRGIPQVRA